MRDFLFTLLFGCFSVPAMTRAWLAVLIWTCLDDMNPHRFCYSYASYTIPFSMIIAGITAISILISEEPYRFTWSREVVVLLLFILWMTFTSFFALNTDVVWEAWDRAMKAQMLIFATLLVIDKRERLHLMMWVVAVSIGIYGVKGGIWTIMTGGSYRVRGPAHSFIEDNNDIALALVTVIPLMRYLQLETQKHWVKIGFGIAIGLSCLAAIASYSRAGLLALITVSILLLIKSRKKLLFGTFMICSILAILQFMPQEWFDRMHTLQTMATQQDGSTKGRLNAWGFAWNLVKSRPITGGGYRCFTPNYFLQYAPDPEDYHEAHSIFLKILAEHGFIGLFLFLTLAVWTWRSATQVRRLARSGEIIWAADMAAMLQVALAGYAVGGAFSNLAYFGLPYQLMAMVVLLKRVVIEELSQREESETALQFDAPLNGQAVAVNT